MAVTAHHNGNPIAPGDIARLRRGDVLTVAGEADYETENWNLAVAIGLAAMRGVEIRRAEE